MENLKLMIEKAQEISKQKFLRFVKDMYDVDEYFFEHLWDVPIISLLETDSIIQTELTTKNKEEISKIISEFVKGEIGKHDGCFVYFDKMESKFTDKEREEWKNRVDNGEIRQDYNSMIVYNEKELAQLYEHEFAGTDFKTTQELDKAFMNYLVQMIMHERSHLNANYLTTEVVNSEFESDIVNGAEIDIFKEGDILKYEDRNEVILDTLAQMITRYKKGDQILDCLYKVIERRKGKSQYNDIDDREVLAIYTLFPEELTQWAVFGAYDFIRENKLQQKIFEVFGTDIGLDDEKMKKKLYDYICTMEESDELKRKKLEMLKLLGLIENIDIKQVKEMAYKNESKDALGSFAGTLLDIKSFLNKNQR